MNLIGKKFTDLISGRLVEVKDQFEDIIVLDNNSKLKLNRLMDKDYFDEYIDPQSFFKNETMFNNFVDKIRQIPDNIVSNISENVASNGATKTNIVDFNNIPGSTSINPMFNEPAVLQSDPELEKEELMRKYGIQNNHPIQAAKQQLEKFQRLLGEEPIEDVQRVEVIRNESSDVVERVEVVNRVIDNQPEFTIQPERTVVSPKVVDDPIITMFKNVKRNNEFKISIDIENKIPRADFIEMMEDSYNTSIIDFLADEFTNNLLSNPNIIKDRIKDAIKVIVYGKIDDNKNEKTDKSTDTNKPRRTRKKLENKND